MNYNNCSFDPSILTFPMKGKKWVSFHHHHRLFQMLLGYIASNLIEDDDNCTLPGGGYSVDVLPSKSAENPMDLTTYDRIMLRIGYGQYAFRSLSGEIFHALHQHVGKPVGTGCGVELMSNLIIFTSSDLSSLGHFLSQLVRLSERPEEGKFLCFTWNIQNLYWREDVRVNNRPIESVVLPSILKNKLVTDIEKFLCSKTKDFYLRNGIPYRRSYLFYGIPGTGKTSMVQALAGHFKRNVCFLLPTHPEMTDDNLREAIHQIPENSIVVFEDIDALFTKDRENKLNKSALTFSGLLNALDGIGSPNGQIFVLTTNLRDNLDNALIRNGRVDLHIHFTYANEEQMEQMWNNFYPSSSSVGATSLAKQFSSGVMASLKEKNLSVTTSALQHFFITQMDALPEEALLAVPSIVNEILQNSSKTMIEEATTNSDKVTTTSASSLSSPVFSETSSSDGIGMEEKESEVVSGNATPANAGKKKDKSRQRRLRQKKRRNQESTVIF
jgi:chaperone BCS1